MSDDKKKKLEDLKRRNEKLKEQQIKATGTATSSTTPSTVVGSSRITKADEILEKVQNSRLSTSVNLDDLKRQSGILKEHMNRYRSEILTVSKLSESYIRTQPEKYDVETQVDLEKEFKYDSDEESTVDKNIGYRKSIFQSKTKTNMPNLVTKKTTAFNENEERKIQDESVKQEEVTKGPMLQRKLAVSEEHKRQLLNSVEMVEFLRNKSKLVERVFFLFN
jgi:hypothetical protein